MINFKKRELEVLDDNCEELQLNAARLQRMMDRKAAGQSIGQGPDRGVGLVVGETFEERQLRIDFRNHLVLNLKSAVAAFEEWGDVEYFYAAELELLNIGHEYWKQEKKDHDHPEDQALTGLTAALASDYQYP